MAFGFLVIEFGFVMVTVLLSHMGLGELAWARILGGDLIGAAIAFVMLSRRLRLAGGFRVAGVEKEIHLDTSAHGPTLSSTRPPCTHHPFHVGSRSRAS